MAVRKGGVDPAALLMSVIAAAIGPLTTAGLWGVFNTVTAAVVLAVLWSFAWPEKEELFSWRQSMAISLVLGLLGAVLLAWPAQWLVSQSPWLLANGAHYTNDKNVVVEDVASDGTWGGLVAGAIIGAFCFYRLRKHHNEECQPLVRQPAEEDR
jgi:hypothetical protein